MATFLDGIVPGSSGPVHGGEAVLGTSLVGRVRPFLVHSRDFFPTLCWLIADFPSGLKLLSAGIVSLRASGTHSLEFPYLKGSHQKHSLILRESGDGPSWWVSATALPVRFWRPRD